MAPVAAPDGASDGGRAYIAKALQVDAAGAPSRLVDIERHAAGPNDIVIAIKYCGVCHSDVHGAYDDFAENAFGGFPIVLGHEAVGVVEYVGPEVAHFKVGDHAGVGFMVDSCLSCAPCERSDEQYCAKGFTSVIGAKPTHGHAGPGDRRTQGGFSSRMTLHEHFAARIPKSIPLEKAAPIMCAGITMWDPLVHWKAGSERVKRVGIAGGGGLGQTGIRLAKALGCEVTAITTSPGKADALRAAGAAHIVISTDENSMKGAAKSLDLILNTISANHDAMHYQPLMDVDGVMVQLGLVSQPHPVSQVPLIFNRNGIFGSVIGGMQAMHDLCAFAAKHSLYPDTKVVPCSDVDKVMAELKGHAPGITRYVLDIANTIDDFENLAGK